MLNKIANLLFIIFASLYVEREYNTSKKENCILCKTTGDTVTTDVWLDDKKKKYESSTSFFRYVYYTNNSNNPLLKKAKKGNKIILDNAYIDMSFYENNGEKRDLLNYSEKL